MSRFHDDEHHRRRARDVESPDDGRAIQRRPAPGKVSRVDMEESRAGGESVQVAAPGGGAAVTAGPWDSDEFAAAAGMIDGAAPEETGATPQVHGVPDGIRDDLEAATGTSLDGVRIHRGPEGGAMAASYDARAVTIQDDIYVADDEMDLGTEDGQHLLAHEIAHVAQQRGPGVSGPAAKLREATSPSDPAEIEADRFADAFVAGAPPGPLTSSLGERAAPQRKGRGASPNVDLTTRPASLAVSVDALTFPLTAIGQESAPQTVTVTNVGTAPVRVEDVAEFPRPTHAFATYAALSGPLQPGESVDLQFAYRPTAGGPQDTIFQVITEGGVVSASIRLDGNGISDERSETPMLRARPTKLTLPPTVVGEYSDPVPVELTNEGRQPVTVEALDVQPAGAGKSRGKPSEFVITGSSDGAIEPGDTTELGVAFHPERRGARKARLVVKANQGATAARIRLQGTGEATEEDLARDAGAALADDADGTVGPVTTYREMLTNLRAAEVLTGNGDKTSYARARSFVAAVDQRMSALGPSFERKLTGFEYTAGMSVFGRASAAVYEWNGKLRLGSSINTDYPLTAFEAAEEMIKLATGEIEYSPSLRGFQRASSYTGTVAAALPFAAVAVVGGGGLAAELTPLLVSEANLLWQSARWIGTEVTIWALANPQSAVALSEILLGFGITIGEDGWEGFAQQFETPEGLLFFLLQTVSDAVQLHGADDVDAGGAPRRGSNVDTDVGEQPPTPRPRTTTDADAPGDAGATASRPRGSAEAGADGEAPVSPEAQEIADRAIARTRQVIDTIEEHVKLRGRATVGPDGETIERVPQRGDDHEYEYDALRPGPLTNHENPKWSLASGFFGGKYDQIVLPEDTLFYRVCTFAEAEGGPSKLGRWYTTEPLQSDMQLQIDAAVRPVWRDPTNGKITGTSSSDMLISVKVPKGTTVYRGPVAPQGDAFLGGMGKDQIAIPDIRQIPGVEIISAVPFHSAGDGR